MTLQELFDQLGAAIYDGVDPNIEVLTEGVRDYNQEINSVWQGDEFLHLSANTSPKGDRKVFWERGVEQVH